MEEVWAQFGDSRKEAQGAYRRFVADGAKRGRRAELMGGGLLRSMGRAPGQWTGVSRDDLEAFDSRILGGGGFVESVLKEAEKSENPRAIKTMTLGDVVERVEKAYGVTQKELTQKGRRKAITRAKAVLIYLGTLYKGETCRKMGELTAMTVQSAAKAKSRGETFIQTQPELIKLIN